MHWPLLRYCLLACIIEHEWSILARERVAAPLFGGSFSAETKVEVLIQLAQAMRVNLFSTLIIFKSYLAYCPCTGSGNSASNKITAKGYSFGCLFRKIAHAQSSSYGDE